LFEITCLLTFNKNLDIYYYLYTFVNINLLLNNFSILTKLNNVFYTNLNYNFFTTSNYLPFKSELRENKVPYMTTNVNNHITSDNILYQYSENSLVGSNRFSRFSLPLVNYDYKCGNYLGIWEKLYPHLTLSFIEVARGIRKSS